MSYRKPKSPIGLHQHAVVGSHVFPTKFGSYQRWLQFMHDEWNLGLYLVLSEAGRGSLDIVEMCATAGIEPVLRIQPDGGHPHPGLGIDRQQVRDFVSAGALYIQVGNEPDNKGEWDNDDSDGGKQHGLGNREALVHQFMHNAGEIDAGGGIAMLLPMNAGYPDYNTDTGEITDDASDKVSHLNFFRDADRLGYLAQLREMARNQKLAAAIHNRPSNHPPNYPNDPTCLHDPSYFQNKYNFSPKLIDRLKADSTCFNSYMLIDDINVKYLGMNIPLIGTEAGYTIEVGEDSRYPKIKDRPQFPRKVYEDFSPFLDGNRLRYYMEWSHSDLNLELIKHFYAPNGAPEHFYGLCFYHASGINGPDSPTEGWYDNPSAGRDLEITETLPAFVVSIGQLPPKEKPNVPETKPELPEKTVTFRPMGVHGNNFPAMTTEDLEVIYFINPSVVLLCQDDFPLAKDIKSRIPDITIIGRVFGEGDLWNSWHIIEESDPNKLYAYGQWVGNKCNQYPDIDIIQYMNEPGVDNKQDFWFTKEGYELIAKRIPSIVGGIRSVSSVRIGTVPLSPGHNEDDDPNGFGIPGGKILKPAFDLHDVWLLHNYWSAMEVGSHLSEWRGQRHIRQREVYEVHASGKPWFITEWNREERIIPGDAEMMEFADQAKEWHDEVLASGDNLYGGCCMYILRSGDPDFARMQLYKNHLLQDMMKSENARGLKKDTKMDLYVKWPMPMPVALTNQSVTLDVELHEGGPDGPLAKVTGAATATLMLPRTPEDYEYPDGIDPITLDPEVEGDDVDGKLRLVFHIPNVQLPGPMAGTVRVNFITFPDTSGTVEKVSPPMLIVPNVDIPATPPTPPTPPVVQPPVMPPSGAISMVSGVRLDRLDWLLARIWETKDEIAGLNDYLDRCFRWAKDETTVQPVHPQ